MIECKQDIWRLHDLGYWVCVTTNSVTRHNGDAIMGKGIALQAAQRFPDLPHQLGCRLRALQEKDPQWNIIQIFHNYRLITFPTKHHWRFPSVLKLIIRSYTNLSALMDQSDDIDGPVFLPRPGCSNGQLDWFIEVRPALKRHNDNRIIIVHQ